MSKWQNFSIWRGRLPHWRADGVTYYATFRHRRPLNPDECMRLLDQLRRPDGRHWLLKVACVLPESTEMIFRVIEAVDGRPGELSNIIEKAKNRAAKQILKVSGERYSPFFVESYDRILRDDAELEERLLSIIGSPCANELCEDPAEYDAMWLEPESRDQ